MQGEGLLVSWKRKQRGMSQDETECPWPLHVHLFPVSGAIMCVGVRSQSNHPAEVRK